MSVSGWGAGCLSLRAERVFSSRSLMVSSEEARRTAPLKSPSSSLEEIQAARDSQDCWDGLCGRLLEGCWSGSPSSLIIWVTRVAKILRCPACFGARRQRTEKRNRRSQQLVEFSLTTSSIMDASLLAARLCAERRILFRILTFGAICTKQCDFSSSVCEMVVTAYRLQDNTAKEKGDRRRTTINLEGTALKRLQ